MPTLAEIRQQNPDYADMSDTDLANALHRKFYRDMPREEFDKRMGLATGTPAQQELNKYQKAAREQSEQLKAKGIDTTAGLVRLGLQGATFNTADELLAGALTPFEMVRQGTWDPREGYQYAKAKQDLDVDEGRKQAGWAAPVAEVAGGIGTGIGLARGGITAGRWLGQNAGILPRSGAAAADAGGMGLLAGLGEGNSFDERFGNAAFGGGAGGLLGGATPGAMKLLGAAASPIVSNVRARMNPEGYARSQVARGLTEASVTPQQIADEVAMAAREGQGMFTVADAMGNPGQRMLSTTTRAPGPGRTEAVEFLDARQAGQGRRVANTLEQGFDANMTADQARTRLTGMRDAMADTEYGAARQGAGPVDLTGAIGAIDRIMPRIPGGAPAKGGLRHDSIETRLADYRSRMTDGRVQLEDYVAIERLRGDLADEIQKAVQGGAGNKARLLGQVQREIDAAMENASQGFRDANAAYQARSRVIGAVDEGRTAAMRGRTEDIGQAYRGHTRAGQVAFRTGYVDPLIEQAQGAAFGANKARPLTSDAFRAEARAMAPQNDLMQRRLGRENRMFETRAHATGNSRTADNLADQGAMGVDPSFVTNLLTGNLGGAARSLLTSGQNAMTGNTAAVRQEVARLLTMRGGNVTPQQLQQILQEAVDKVLRGRSIASVAGRGAAGGLAIADQTLRR